MEILRESTWTLNKVTKTVTVTDTVTSPNATVFILYSMWLVLLPNGPHAWCPDTQYTCVPYFYNTEKQYKVRSLNMHILSFICLSILFTEIKQGYSLNHSWTAICHRLPPIPFLQSPWTANYVSSKIPPPSWDGWLTRWSREPDLQSVWPRLNCHHLCPSVSQINSCSVGDVLCKLLNTCSVSHTWTLSNCFTVREKDTTCDWETETGRERERKGEREMLYGVRAEVVAARRRNMPI